MEKDLLDGKIGNVGAYDLEFKDGKLQLKLDVAPLPGVTAGLHAEVGAEPVVKLLFAKAKAAIPGQVDDAVLGTVEAFLLQALKG